MARILQSVDELNDHLADHLGFLGSSADAFDAGNDGEAKRLAVSLRVLFHDTAQSHSLLGQLDRLRGSFLSTAIPHDAGNLSTHGGLIMTAMNSAGATYIAPLDTCAHNEWRPFPAWWNETVFVDVQKTELTRRDLVLAVANQDGGAHVDPNLSEAYARLSRHNSMGWVQSPGNAAIPNPERAAIRQISHEVLKTFFPKYRRKSNTDGMTVFGGAMLHQGTRPPSRRICQNFGRNDLCPCGSGKKYKHCHGNL